MIYDICVNRIGGFSPRHCGSRAKALKSGILALLLVAASGIAVAADQSPTSNTCNVSEEEAAGLNGDFSGDVQAGREFISTISHMLQQEKFKELDCLADHARTGKERLPGGMWKIKQVYAGLYEPVQYPMHATQEDWAALLKKLRRWVTVRPQSVTARVALASAYIAYAGDARGNGFADTVTENGWKLFGERVAEARRILAHASSLRSKCPEWYLQMLLVAEDQDWDAAKKRALFEEANKFEPGYYYYDRVYASHLLPKWGGELGDTEKFAQEIADRTGGDQADILYFEIASANYVICGCDGDPHLSWDRIERGFEASEKQYGVSMQNLNRIAFLASDYGESDPIVAEKVFNRIGEQWDEETWRTKDDFANAKFRATNNAPILAKRRVIEAAAEGNMQTPEGRRYQTTLEEPYKSLVRQCVQPGGADAGTFKTLINVGDKGTVQDIRIYWHSAASHCVYEKLRAFQQEKATIFPPPPQAPYWVRLDVDWGEVASAAAK